MEPNTTSITNPPTSDGYWKKGPCQKHRKAHARSNGAFLLEISENGHSFFKKGAFLLQKEHFGPAPREHFCSKKFFLQWFQIISPRKWFLGNNFWEQFFGPAGGIH
ncbi:Uncharacterized protein Fot_42996 [Forsythia ovata]|uniref:Uncharacterized protein n=1 Tax=Forsythia ovata TaxID=205694 RepID=A0ABD1RNS5_9LAMI